MVKCLKKYIKNGTFRNFLKSKFDPNIYQKRTKLHHFKKFSQESMPRTPLAKRMASPCAACRLATCKFPNLKKEFLAPPSQILATLLIIIYLILKYMQQIN